MAVLVNTQTGFASVSAPGSSAQLDTSLSYTSYVWAIDSAPAGSSASLSSTSVKNPTFTPDVRGSYRFRLQPNGSVDPATWVYGVLGVLEPSGRRVPAKGELLEAGGWDGAVDAYLQAVDALAPVMMAVIKHVVVISGEGASTVTVPLVDGLGNSITLDDDGSGVCPNGIITNVPQALVEPTPGATSLTFKVSDGDVAYLVNKTVIVILFVR